jgi:Flp pilus assembly protein TadG
MKHRFERGSSMVEFCVVASALFLVLFGVLEFGRMLYIYHTVSNAARIGARWAIVRGAQSCGYAVGKALSSCPASQSEIESFVQSQVPLLDSGSITVTASWPGGTNGCPAGATQSAGCPVIVTASHNFNFAIPYVDSAQIPISSSSQMIIAQ